MYNYNASAKITEALHGAGIIHEDDMQEVLDVLNGYWEDTIAIYWSVEDVLHLDDTLSRDQAREILEIALNSHDAGQGINWTVLETHILMYKLPER